LVRDSSFLQFTEGAIRHPLVKNFISSGYGEFKKYVVKTVDAELAGKIRIAEAYRHQLTSHISQIKSKTVSDMRMAGELLFFVCSS
jgi:hypothetical protein